MKPLFDDTHPKIEAMYIAGIRAMTPEVRFARTGALFAVMDRYSEMGVRHNHPDAPPDEVRLRVLSRRIPADLMHRAYGWDVKEKGY